jgi:hypothetical protein
MVADAQFSYNFFLGKVSKILKPLFVCGFMPQNVCIVAQNVWIGRPFKVKV